MQFCILLFFNFVRNLQLLFFILYAAKKNSTTFTMSQVGASFGLRTTFLTSIHGCAVLFDEVLFDEDSPCTGLFITERHGSDFGGQKQKDEILDSKSNISLLLDGREKIFPIIYQFFSSALHIYFSRVLHDFST